MASLRLIIKEEGGEDGEKYKKTIDYFSKLKII